MIDWLIAVIRSTQGTLKKMYQDRVIAYCDKKHYSWEYWMQCLSTGTTKIYLGAVNENIIIESSIHS